MIVTNGVKWCPYKQPSDKGKSKIYKVGWLPGLPVITLDIQTPIEEVFEPPNIS